ncbi:MAG TPA: rhomboid family intramembrane serine protease [Bacteroidia bacterium]|nr:rhomboid family intramembrane serine protease [Bacteroidia bacterium]
MQEFRPSSLKLLPDVIKNIMIVSALAYFADLALNKIGFDLNAYAGLYLPASENFHWWQYFSYMFLHGSLTHIFLNMFAFWMFGGILENLWGPKRFLIFFLVTGLGAALIHTAVGYYELHSLQAKADAFFNAPGADAFSIFIKDNIPYQYLNADYAMAVEGIKSNWYAHGDSPMIIEQARQAIDEYIRFKTNIPTVGASGAVYGVLMAFGILFPNTLIYLYFFIPLKAKYLVLIIGGIELYSAWQSNPTDNVAHFAHLGGMLFGYLLLRYWQKNNRSQLF